METVTAGETARIGGVRDANACESKRIEVAVRFRKLDTPNQRGSVAWRLASDEIANGLGSPYKRTKIRTRFSDVPSR